MIKRFSFFICMILSFLVLGKVESVNVKECRTASRRQGSISDEKAVHKLLNQFSCFEGVSFSDFTLSNAKCSEMQFIGCIFENVIMKEVDFSHSLFRGCFFKNCIFKKCDFGLSEFRELTVDDEKHKLCIVNSQFKKCEFRTTLHEEVIFAQTGFDGCVFKYAMTKKCQYWGTFFINNEFSDTSSVFSHYTSCLFDENTFKNSFFEHVLFDRTQIQKKFLRNINFQDIDIFDYKKKVYILKNIIVRGNSKRKRIFIPKKFNVDDQDCCLCGEAFDVEAECKRKWLLCGHSFCQNCSILHLINSGSGIPSCPLCKEDFIFLRKKGIIPAIINILEPRKTIEKAFHKINCIKWVRDY